MSDTTQRARSTASAEGYYTAAEDCWRAVEALEDVATTLRRLGDSPNLAGDVDRRIGTVRDLANRCEAMADFHMEGAREA